MFLKNPEATIFWIVVLKLISRKAHFITICVSFGLYQGFGVYGIESGNIIIIFQRPQSPLQVGF